MPNKETHAAERVQLTQDVEKLRQELAKLKLDHSALATFIDKARWRNFLVILFVSVATAMGWIAGASDWLRWYLLPITLLLCGLFTFGARRLQPYTAHRISQLDAVVAEAEAALSQPEK